MRQNDFSNPQFLVSVDPTTGSGLTWCPAINTMGLQALSVTIKPISGTVNGYFKLQVTDFGVDALHLPVAADWVDVPGSENNGAGTGAVSATISAAINWQLGQPFGGKWVRAKFVTGSSSSPVISAAVTGRALP